MIVGHTDALPVRYSAFPDNQQLSLQRAAAVARLFTQNGLEENNITVRGLADQQPVSSNSTVAGRAKNRRVELFVTY
ncbi:OmpA/MotB family protein [Tatumella morbirosei]|uniref:OmpA/MotB family protein n=1 Tax=Tatumella morbirosei TaxID=642227 RepID=UPI00069BAFDC|nr:OmpA family protein [Tatumella morbirosei]